MELKKIKVLLAFGTRPEVIKLYPLFLKFSGHPLFEVTTATTGQHDDLLHMTLDDLAWKVDYNFSIMRKNQSNLDVLENTISSFRLFLNSNDFDVVLVHGDTTSALGISLAAHALGIKVGHVEAGLRSGNLREPWPEEANRRVIDVVSSFKFAPTEESLFNLTAEGLGENAYITGNTIVDMVWQTLLKENNIGIPNLTDGEASNEIQGASILVTQHRRESFGFKMHSVLTAVKRLADDGHSIVFPVHPNPNVKLAVNELLLNHPNINLIDPLPYSQFIKLLDKSDLVITDSGGMQEECAILGIPILITREVTERPEVSTFKNVHITGSDGEKIFKLAKEILNLKTLDRKRDSSKILGDGNASTKIISILDEFFQKHH